MPLNAQILRQFPNEVFVETGTQRGAGIAAALEAGFEDVRSVELDEGLYNQALKRYMEDYRVMIFHGDSGEVLGQMMGDIRCPATVWLDAHQVHVRHCGFNRGNCPILRELDVLARHPVTEHTLLIDDYGLFEKKFPGSLTITAEDVTVAILEINPWYETRVIDYGPKGILVAEV